MTSQIDFFALYRELGIEPECSPEAFKHAYRRRVSELHPDREGAAGEEALKLLNLGYAAALEFFHVHGRFPGAPAATARAGRHAAGGMPPRAAPAQGQPLHRVVVEEPPGGARRPPGLRPGRWLSIVLVALVVVAVVGTQVAGGGGEEEAPDAHAWAPSRIATRTAVASPFPAAVIDVGMPAKDVLAALGTPTDTAEDGRLWHYGPSWVRLSCREVVDWYSSPLKPLGASPMHPDPPGEENERVGTCLEFDPATLR
jgi:hypothetical protein